MTTTTPNETQFEPSSFQDPGARVFYQPDDATHVYRALNEAQWQQWQALKQTELWQELIAQDQVITTDEAPRQLASSPEWHGVLKHPRIPFISYPYEWCFDMLKDAALLQLGLLQVAIESDWTVKDASAYNIQWWGSLPQFIDISSFEPMATATPWIGYEQFCQQFLFPLMLTRYQRVPFQPWLRTNLAGLTRARLSTMLSPWHTWRSDVFRYITLPNWLKKDIPNQSTEQTRDTLLQAGYNKNTLLNTLHTLRLDVSQLKAPQIPSVWQRYQAQCPSYTPQAQQEKTQFIEAVAQKTHHKLAWDLGCNNGQYSECIAPYCDWVVAMDNDFTTINTLYQHLKVSSHHNILPLVMDLTNPSPNLGWQNQERQSLVSRSQPDFILCLALLHHLVFTHHIPIDSVLNWLSGFNADIIIEFVDPEDPFVQQLQQTQVNPNTQHPYSRSHFESCLAERFNIDQQCTLSQGTRHLYYARPR